jgi:hypothetical protein
MEEVMHPMFVTLFFDTGANDLLAEEEDRRSRARHRRPRMAARVVIRQPSHGS